MSKEKNILQWQLFWFYCSGTNLCSQDIFHGGTGALFLLVFNLQEVLLLYLLVGCHLFRGEKAFLKLPFFKQFLNQIDWWFYMSVVVFFMSQWPFKGNLDENFWQLAYSLPDPTLLGICVSIQSRTRIPLCIIITSK